MRTRALFSLLGLLACASLESNIARAQSGSTRVDKATCLDAVSKGQRLRDTHKLVLARDKFRVCARAECPSVVQTDCANWLAEIETTMPTVVLSAKDRGGRDVLDLKVSVDGQPLASTLDGQAVAVDPGMRTFRFERADGRAVTTQVLVKEGGKAQAVAVVVSGGESAVAALPQQRASSEAESGETTMVPVHPSGSGNSARLLGLLTAGLGLVGVGVAVGIAVDAKERDNRAATEPGAARQTDSGNAVTEGNIATVAFGIGGAMTLAGAVLWFVAPSGRSSAAIAPTAGPTLGVATDGRGAYLRGSF